MAEVTREMILDYMIRKGGVVKNVDLVRHFRKFLQLDEPLLKGKSCSTGEERKPLRYHLWSQECVFVNGRCSRGFEAYAVSKQMCPLPLWSSQSCDK